MRLIAWLVTLVAGFLLIQLLIAAGGIAALGAALREVGWP